MIKIKNYKEIDNALYCCNQALDSMVSVLEFCKRTECADLEILSEKTMSEISRIAYMIEEWSKGVGYDPSK